MSEDTPPNSTFFNHSFVLGCLIIILSPILKTDASVTSIVLLPAGMYGLIMFCLVPATSGLKPFLIFVPTVIKVRSEGVFPTPIITVFDKGS